MYNIYFNISENSGVGYYRQYLIAIALKELGLAKVLINDFTWGEARLFCERNGFDCKYVLNGFHSGVMTTEYIKHVKEVHKKEPSEDDKFAYERGIVQMVEPSAETLQNIGKWADILVCGRRDVPEYLSQWGGMREFFNIPFVLDTDDDVHATRPYNPGYRGYHPGSENLTWNRKAISEADAVTVSTEQLKQIVSRDNKNVYVVPNCVELPKWEGERDEHDEIRIAMLLSASHHEDAKLIQKPLIKVLKDNPKVHVYYTDIYNYIFDGEESIKAQLHPIPWIPLAKWPQEIVRYNFDIGLAPLVDNMFNRSKSNLRFIEYSAAKMATIVSPTQPYKETVTHNKTALVASTDDEWEQALTLLIQSKALREKIADNAYKLVVKKFNIFTQAKNHLKTYEKIIKDFRKLHGKPKFPRVDFEKIKQQTDGLTLDSLTKV